MDIILKECDGRERDIGITRAVAGGGGVHIYATV